MFQPNILNRCKLDSFTSLNLKRKELPFKISFQPCLTFSADIYWNFFVLLHVPTGILHMHNHTPHSLHLIDGVILLWMFCYGLRSRVIAPLSLVLEAVWIPPSTWWNDLTQSFSLVCRTCKMVAKHR